MSKFFVMQINNVGQYLESTNYWESAHAQLGYVYLSWNAGAARLLVPDAVKHSIDEMRTASSVIVSSGPWTEQGGNEGFEILFEDHSNSPYCIHLMAGQTDLLPHENRPTKSFPFSVWTSEGKQLELPAKYRAVKAIPCLAPWTK